MVFISHVISKLDAHALSKIDILICLRHLFGSIAVVNMKLLFKRYVFLHAPVAYSELPSNTVCPSSSDPNYIGIY